MIIAVVLSVDDAALPADSAEDLQSQATLFEQYRNDHRLFISTCSSFAIVFHSASDGRVFYQDDYVFVDGARVEIKIYDRVIKATHAFKYFGLSLTLHALAKHIQMLGSLLLNVQFIC